MLPPIQASSTFQHFQHLLSPSLLSQMAPSMTILSVAAAKKLDARLRELLNDGLSDAQIARIVRREASSEGAPWPVLTVKAIRDRIYDVADSESDSDYDPAEDSDGSSTTTSSESEYIPETDSESESESKWGGEETDSDSNSDDETYESDDSSSASTGDEEPHTSKTKKQKQQIVKTARFFMDNDDGTMDRISITPNGDGTFAVEMAYDLTYSYNYPDRASFFEGSAEEVHEYLESILQLLAIDELPYMSVEASIPFYPAIRVCPHRLLKKVVRKCILGALSQYLGHYASA